MCSDEELQKKNKTKKKNKKKKPLVLVSAHLHLIISVDSQDFIQKWLLICCSVCIPSSPFQYGLVLDKKFFAISWSITKLERPRINERTNERTTDGRKERREEVR